MFTNKTLMILFFHMALSTKLYAFIRTKEADFLSKWNYEATASFRIKKFWDNLYVVKEYG